MAEFQTHKKTQKQQYEKTQIHDQLMRRTSIQLHIRQRRQPLRRSKRPARRYIDIALPMRPSAATPSPARRMLFTTRLSSTQSTTIVAAVVGSKRTGPVVVRTARSDTTSRLQACSRSLRRIPVKSHLLDPRNLQPTCKLQFGRTAPIRKTSATGNMVRRMSFIGRPADEIVASTFICVTSIVSR